MVARLNGVQEAPGSNPGGPTRSKDRQDAGSSRWAGLAFVLLRTSPAKKPRRFWKDAETLRVRAERSAAGRQQVGCVGPLTSRAHIVFHMRTRRMKCLTSIRKLRGICFGGVHRGTAVHTARPGVPERRRLQDAPAPPGSRSRGRSRHRWDWRIPKAPLGGSQERQRETWRSEHDKDEVADLSPDQKRLLKAAIEQETRQRAQRRGTRRE